MICFGCVFSLLFWFSSGCWAGVWFWEQSWGWSSPACQVVSPCTASHPPATLQSVNSTRAPKGQRVIGQLISALISLELVISATEGYLEGSRCLQAIDHLSSVSFVLAQVGAWWFLHICACLPSHTTHTHTLPQSSQSLLWLLPCFTLHIFSTILNLLFG